MCIIINIFHICTCVRPSRGSWKIYHIYKQIFPSSNIQPLAINISPRKSSSFILKFWLSWFCVGLMWAITTAMIWCVQQPWTLQMTAFHNSTAQLWISLWAPLYGVRLMQITLYIWAITVTSCAHHVFFLPSFLYQTWNFSWGRVLKSNQKVVGTLINIVS